MSESWSYDSYSDDEPLGLYEGYRELLEEEAHQKLLQSAPQSTPPPERVSSSQKAQFLTGLADQLAESGQLFLIQDGPAYVYPDETGCFRPIASLEAYVANTLPKEVIARLPARDLRDVVERLQWNLDIYRTLDSFNSYPELVNLSNSVFSIETNEILPHDPKYCFTYVIRAKYLEDDSDVVCPCFEAFCQSSLEGDPIKRQLLLEILGYILLDTNAGKCAFFLKGQPDSGKSIITTFVTRLFMPEFVAHIPLHHLNNRFYRAELAGKKLNTAGEIAGRALTDISDFKAITGNDCIEGEFKGCDPFYFVSNCKLLFSGSTIPLTTDLDATTAFVNRVRVLLFNKSIPPKEQDKALLDKLLWEKDSIVTLAVHAAHDLAMRNFVFALPEDSKEFLRSYKLRGNILRGFIEECCILDRQARVFNVNLYAAFETYCERNGIKTLSREKFYELLSGVPYVTMKRIRVGNENRRGHVGIKLKEGL